jgi:hypothetical protein
MSSDIKNLFRNFFSDYFSWLALLICAGFAFLFIWWFHASWLASLLIISGSVFLIGLWGLWFLKSGGLSPAPGAITVDSEEFRKSIPHLKKCPDNFRKPVLECMLLTDRIRTEFKNDHYKSEIENLLKNIAHLIYNHAKLDQRSREFGTDKQKKHMQLILNKQVDSVNNSLAALQSFSGNLTLMDVHATFDSNVNDNLKSINESLADALEEVDNDFS